MKIVKIKFVDFWQGFEPESSRFWKSMIRCGYTPTICDAPEYLVYSVFGRENLKYEDCVRIFYTGENYVPDFNLADYAIGFEWMEYGDRYLRLPIFYWYEEDLKLCLEKHLFKDSDLREKTEFCSFVYSNSMAAEERKDIFYALSRYKKVNSGGRYLNNIGEPGGVADKRSFQKKHKFSIACENSSHPGYVTEKLVECFAAGTIPVYWGDPKVTEMFNPKAFINVMDYTSLDEVVEYVKYLDNNEDKYLRILAEPAIIDPNFYPEAMQRRLDKFISNLLEQPKEKAFRRTRCCWGKIYFESQVEMVADLEFERTYRDFVLSKAGMSAYKLYKLKCRIKRN